MSLLATLFIALSGCTDSAAEMLLTCEGGNLDTCYRDGVAAATAARPRYGDARKLFAQACMPSYQQRGKPEKNHPGACYSLAKLVRDAKGGPTDQPRAAELFEIACRGGIQASCVDLGIAVYDPPANSGVRAEPERATELFNSACNEVDVLAPAEEGAQTEEAHPMARACEALGHAYEAGKGIDGNRKMPDKAAEYYNKACDARFAPGCVSAGRLAGAKRVRADTEAAAVLFERGCRLDARHGCFELAQLHEKGAWPAATDELAVEFYRKTCNIDPTRGCYEAAWLMEMGKVEARDGEIESLYNAACEHGHTEACTKRNLR